MLDQQQNPIRGMFRGLFTLRGFLKYGLIAIAAVAVAAVIYFNTVMTPKPFLEWLDQDAAQIPVSGQVNQYGFDKKRYSLALTGEDMTEDLWNAISNSELRYLRYISAAAAPEGGYYYEVSLTHDDGSATSFGCNSTGDVILNARTYKLVGESRVLDVLDALFTQYEGEAEPLS